MIIASGASSFADVCKAIEVVTKFNSNICLMQCNTNYTGSLENFKYINLNVLNSFKENFPNIILGLSDHTLGTAIASSSLHYGVRVIEKHFTINKKLKKSADHKISLDPKDLKKLRLDVDEINSAIGFGKKIVLKCENLTRKFARRSIFLKNFKFKGQKLEYDDLIAKRPGDGISANLIDKVVNRKINKNLAVDHKLSFKDFNY